MATPSLANTWKVNTQYKVGPIQMENTFHVEAPTLADPADVANDVAQAWTASASLLDVLSDQWLGGLISVQPYDGSSSPIEISAPSFDGAEGNINTEPVPAQVCAIATKKTLVAGRSQRGRFYLGGCSQGLAASDGSRWGDGTFTSFSGSFVAFLANLQGSSTVTNMLVYSYTHNTSAVVNQLVLRKYFGTQRRRSEQAESLP